MTAEPGEPGGLVVNTGVQEALEVWATTKDARTFAGVLRRAVVGDLLLDATGSQWADPARGFQRGDVLAIGSHRDESGRDLLLAFTDNPRLAAIRPESPVGLAQTALSVLELAADRHDGIALDAGHPGSFVAMADEIRAALGADPAAAARLASDLARRARPFPEFLDDLARAPVYVAVDVLPEERVAVRSAIGAEGASLGALFTSPAEVWAWSPGSQARPTRLANVARVALEDGQAGVVVNPAGPSATLEPGLLATLAADPPELPGTVES